MGDDPALLARRFWALPSCSPARRVRPASGLSPHRSHGGRLPLLSPGQVCLHPFGRSLPVPLRSRLIQPRPAGLPLRSGADESPASRKAEGKNPPDLRSPSPFRVHGGAPFSFAP